MYLLLVLAMMFGMVRSAFGSEPPCRLEPYHPVTAEYRNELKTFGDALTALQTQLDAGTEPDPKALENVTRAMTTFCTRGDVSDRTQRSVVIQTVSNVTPARAIVVLGWLRLKWGENPLPGPGFLSAAPEFIVRRDGEQWVFYSTEPDFSKTPGASPESISQRECLFTLNPSTGETRTSNLGAAQVFGFLPRNPLTAEERERARRIRRASPGVPEM